ncbi:acetyl-CoA carboxylase biotin carboxyl carrier protein subunit, partial [Streptomonospora halophila]|uniref:acetyl-CoA carboxylase biotin carboxyl carrier protein subunit n=1 Tax=Streptomonospora halophila TaxID=427369 RepID=UPI0031E56618
RGAARRGGRTGGTAAAAGGDALVSPMQGTVVKVVAEDGQTVAEGDPVVVIEAMKMEQPLTAHKSGVVTGLSVAAGDGLSSGGVVCEIKDG